MRFRQPAIKNMPKRIMEVPKCKKESNKIHDITGELSSNGMLPC
jgi:hypothetical protein